MIVCRFYGRGNQANKLTFSSTCSVLCLSLLAPTAPCTIYFVPCGHAAGICAQAPEGGGSSTDCSCSCSVRKAFWKDRLSQGTRSRTSCCAAPAGKEECVSAWPALSCWLGGPSLLPGHEQAREPCRLLLALPHHHLRDFSRDEQCFNITVGKKPAC